MLSIAGNQLMGAGFSAAQASAILGNAPTTGISAAGTTLATATALSAPGNLVGTAAANSGVRLPTTAVIGDAILIYNDATGNSFYIYPDAATSKINQLSVGAGVLLANNNSALLMKVSSTRWIMFLSA